MSNATCRSAWRGTLRDPKKLEAFISANGSGIADDVDGDPVFMARNEFYLGYTKERAEGITFSNVKDVKKA